METFAINKVKEITNYLNKQLKEIEKIQVDKNDFDSRLYKQSLIDIIENGLLSINEEFIPYNLSLNKVYAQRFEEDLNDGIPITDLSKYGEDYVAEGYITERVFIDDYIVGVQKYNNFTNEMMGYFEAHNEDEFPLRFEIKSKADNRLLQLIKDGVYIEDFVNASLIDIEGYFNFNDFEDEDGFPRNYKVCDLEYDKDNFTLTGSAIIGDLEDLENYDEI